MNALILAATSFTIAVSLMITGKQDNLQRSFAGLCAAVFVAQAAFLFGGFFGWDVLLRISRVGSLAIAPAAILFFRHLIRHQTVISGKMFQGFVGMSLCAALAVFTPLYKTDYFDAMVLYYTFSGLILCYAALFVHVRKMPAGDERRRLLYLLVACPAALIAGRVDLINHWGFNVPAVDGIATSGLLYFVLLVIAYPQLRALHDYFARSLVIFISTCSGAVIFYFAVVFFGGTPPSLEGLMLAPFLIVISISPMKMILRKIVGHYYPESKDIFTSLYEFDEKLEREKSLMLAEMAPVVAHEIRNPLGSIKGAAQYLQSELSTQEQQDMLSVILEGSDRLNNVVSRFLDYARPYKPDMKFQNVNMIIRKAVGIIAANRLAENIDIVQDLDDGLPQVRADDQQLIQVILNIALNAIEAMPRGGTLALRSFKGETDAGQEVIVTISDTGGGIDKKDLKDIFKPFFTTKERGVGLGLAICQKIIKEHGGSIDVQSAPGRGTEFIIRLRADR